MLQRIASICRYPVKSMQGESLAACEVGPAGLVGDRAFALIDAQDGKVASAKNPRKWGVLLACRATTLADGAVEITLPDGSRVRSDDPSIDAVLSKAVGREVHFAATAPDDRRIEELWPPIDGLAPGELIASTTIDTDDGQPVSELPIGLAAPPGSFFDLAVVHLLTTSTLDHLRELEPQSVFDQRRYRPNVLVETDGAGFVENDWVGRELSLGDSVRVAVTLPTMRCVMTTLAQDDLPDDRGTLRAVARHNRLEIADMGTWACAGVYGDVAATGVLRVGDAVALT